LNVQRAAAKSVSDGGGNALLCRNAAGGQAGTGRAPGGTAAAAAGPGHLSDRWAAGVPRAPLFAPSL